MMDWPKLFNSELDVIEKSFQATADSLQSSRMTIYIHTSTQEFINKTLDLNQNLSIKKILDHAALVIYDNIMSFSKTEERDLNLISDSIFAHITDLREHSLKICLFTSIYSNVNLFEMDKKSRKTFVMSKRTESLYRALSSILKVSIDNTINSVFIGYYNHLSGSGLDIYKAYACFMEEYQNLFYKIEDLNCSPFIRHVASFSCSEVGEILNVVFEQYQKIEHIARSAFLTSYQSNHKIIESLDEFYEKVPVNDGYQEVNLKSNYNKEYFDLCHNIEMKNEVPDEDF